MCKVGVNDTLGVWAAWAYVEFGDLGVLRVSLFEYYILSHRNVL
jgi:hypothetical protein